MGTRTYDVAYDCLDVERLQALGFPALKTLVEHRGRRAGFRLPNPQPSQRDRDGPAAHDCTGVGTVSAAPGGLDGTLLPCEAFG